MQPKFEMARTRGLGRKALETGRSTRDRWGIGNGPVVYTPVRIKHRYWTSQIVGASVIHIATGRGVLTQGNVGTDGWITVEPHCYGHLSWPRALSSPADSPERRLCASCLERAHATHSGLAADNANFLAHRAA